MKTDEGLSFLFFQHKKTHICFLLPHFFYCWILRLCYSHFGWWRALRLKTKPQIDLFFFLQIFKFGFWVWPTLELIHINPFTSHSLLLVQQSSGVWPFHTNKKYYGWSYIFYLYLSLMLSKNDTHQILLGRAGSLFHCLSHLLVFFNDENPNNQPRAIWIDIAMSHLYWSLLIRIGFCKKKIN